MHQMPRTKMLQMARRRQWCPTMANIIGIFVGLTTLQMQLARAGTNLQCLVDFKNSIQDPSNMLSSWYTNNVSDESDICYWQGVSCFSNNAPPVYKISLTNIGLSGTWPSGLKLCPSLQSLDLSGNSFTGPIPTTISSDIPNLVYLDVSNNSVGGSIPAELGSCQFLNDLILNDNQLRGIIPAKIGTLKRLVMFDVANNQLWGPIPSGLSVTSKNSSGVVLTVSFNYSGNVGLCGDVVNRVCLTVAQSIISLPGFFIGMGVGFLTGSTCLMKFWIKRPGNQFGRPTPSEDVTPMVSQYGL